MMEDKVDQWADQVGIATEEQTGPTLQLQGVEPVLHPTRLYSPTQPVLVLICQRVGHTGQGTTRSVEFASPYP